MAIGVRKSRISEGSPNPRGATWDGLGVNFALFSANATKVELCLFDDAGRTELERIQLPEYTNEVWHGYLPDARPGTIYGYRVHGPHDPRNGHRFNPNKLVLDPYAKSTVGALRWDNALFGYTIGSKDEDLSLDRRDSARFMPKCRVIDPAFTWGRERRPEVPWDRTILYETHVRGFTKLHPAVPENLRGTFSGLGRKEVLDYIRSLGVTSVELLPIHTFVNDRHLLEKGLTNYWGYNTIGFFAPDPRFSAVPAFVFSEFKEMVARLHDAGLEVILDVVYNHTAEGNERGPTLSFRGIDNASYYRLLPDQPRYYINDTGTGNTFNLSHPSVLQMVTDSLRYWVTEMHVDGFRFDLGTILARQHDGFDESHGFLQSCQQDPVLSQVKLIAEPWDIGPGGYQVGGFSPGWAEWNDKFRDTVRGFWKGDEGKLPEMATRLAASADAFAHRGRKPWSSINFITAHDGFTLHDLVSYNEKHNEANGENSQDGHSDNISWNHGAEGPTDDPEIKTLRCRQMRNLLATLAAGARHADAAGRRRVRPHPARQQQCLWAGQRDKLGGLEHRRGRRCADRLRPPRDRSASGVPDPAPVTVPHRRIQRGTGREGRALAHAVGHRHRGRPMAGHQRPLLRHVDGRACAGDRDQAAIARCDRPAGAERLS